MEQILVWQVIKICKSLRYILYLSYNPITILKTTVILGGLDHDEHKCTWKKNEIKSWQKSTSTSKRKYYGPRLD